MFASSHSYLKDGLLKINREKIKLKQLDETSLVELKKLHKEWFPVKYKDNYFLRIFRRNVVALGAFYRVSDLELNDKNEAELSEKEKNILKTI